MKDTAPPSLAIVGGGLAGMAAALAARMAGWNVTLFEQGPFLGGRVNSIEESWNGQIIDASPHVALGCCTRLLEFCRQLNLDAEFGRHKSLHFLEPSGRAWRLKAAPLLPAPWHLLPSLLRMKSLSFGQRLRLAGTLRQLVVSRRERSPYRSGDASQSRNATEGVPYSPDLPESESLGNWLRRQGQSESTIKSFWSPVMQSALSETVDFISLSAARKVFHEGFFTSRHGYEMYLPQRPWREILDQQAGGRLEELGVAIHRKVRVMWIEADPDAEPALSVVLDDGSARPFDAVILAVPWHQAAGLFSGELSEGLPQLAVLASLQPGSIAAVHLWFDRPILPLPQAALQTDLAPWIFAAKSIDPSVYYYQAVVSAAHRVAPADPRELRQVVLGAVQQCCPEARGARLLHAREVVHPQAVFSPQSGHEQFRLPQKTSVPRLFLAGDWTATGWPATMESAVRSGFLAVEELVKSVNDYGFRA
jgi:predicted NAD/FAD-binding protein